MDANKTDITLVVDRSGSMAAIQADAEGGINTFIRGQSSETGVALLTLVQFDTEYEFVHRGVPINSVPEYKLVPRGSTALLDAVGRAIQETGQRLAAMPEAERPGLVVFVIVTDGHENASREYTKARIKEMIAHQQSVYKWQFTFLGANQDAFAEAAAMGMAQDAAANFSPDKVLHAYAAVNAKLGRMRKATRENQEVCNDFTEQERKEMQN
ncbi:MAG: VWA domain-containing protein [Gemmataceae bacterium]|nr:VWA domain-containing protein [Gemmataceae bacterium]